MTTPRTDRRTATAAARPDRAARRSRATRGALRELLDRAAVEGPPLELGFLRQRHTGTVHVRRPADPRHPAETLSWADLGAALTAPVPTVCGYRARRNHDGLGDAAVSVFADEDLCGNCHRGLGRHAVLAFEHPTPGNAAELGGAS